jgi:hypothetical protein
VARGILGPAVDALQGVHTVRYANDLVEKLDLTKEAWRMEQVRLHECAA